MCQGDPPLFAEAHRPRNPDALAPLRIRGPVLRQVQLYSRRPCQRVGQQRGRDGDLAVRDLAERPAILTADGDRVGAMFRKGGLVDQQDPAAHRQLGAQATPDLGRRPGRMRDEMLQPLIGRCVAPGQPGVHWLHRFPFAVVQQPLDVPAGALALGAATEAAREAIEKLAQSFEHLAG